MNKRLLNILACPIDKHHPLEIFECDTDNEVIKEGVLYCTDCSRFYPITEEIPIMLPDELRDKDQDLEFLRKNKDRLPKKIVKEGLPWHI